MLYYFSTLNAHNVEDSLSIYRARNVIIRVKPLIFKETEEEPVLETAFIFETLRRFALFLKTCSITTYNNATEKYVKELIQKGENMVRIFCYLISVQILFLRAFVSKNSLWVLLILFRKIFLSVIGQILVKKVSSPLPPKKIPG